MLRYPLLAGAALPDLLASMTLMRGLTAGMGHRIGPGRKTLYTHHKKINDPNWKQRDPKYRKGSKSRAAS